MSMSTQHGGGNRKPSTKPVAGAKPKQGGDEAIEDDLDEAAAAASEEDAPVSLGKESTTTSASGKQKASPRKSAPPRKTAPAGKRPAAKKVAPVKVKQGAAWGPIILFSVVGLLALGIVGFAVYQVNENGLTVRERADRIDGIKDYFKINKEYTEQRNHVWGPQKYDLSIANPPVSGNHNQNWQRCLGDVYAAPIATEHALHALEHGAVWITYQPNLPADQVEALAKKVKGKDYLLMSPYEGQAKPISLQAWGFQLQVDKASDGRIDEFIKALRQNASLEPGTPCSQGDIITETGTVPRDLGKDGGGTGMTSGG
ncbi:DUF3105 domain-containing protein [Dactylosporangium sp. NPDC050588]|uniref:DUF3105 domain-containing protein n=1 Tax=Dactylosporangium sp. NPDC050588 TaxID=3157211 RepID=UPI00340FA981